MLFFFFTYVVLKGFSAGNYQQSMFQLDLLIDTSALPSNVMSLRDQNFIDFVKEEAGDGAAALLEIQGINSVKSLLMTTDVYGIMNMNSKSLDGFKRKYGYLQNDNTFVIQPGVKGNTEYLIDLVKQKCVDDARSIKISKRNQPLSSDNTTNPSSTMTQPNSSISSNSLSQSTMSKASNLSINEHKKYVMETVNSWFEDNKSKFNLSYFSLIEGRHYSISILRDSSGTLKGNIKCCCEQWISLTVSRGKFQMSNFYRHLRGLSNGNVCKKMREMIKTSQPISSPPTNDPPISSSMNNQPGSSPTNLVPNTSLLIPNSSNSTILTSFSIPLLARGDENTLIQASQSIVHKRHIKRKVETIESSYATRASAKRTKKR